MPTVLRTGPYRFYFYSHEPNEPPHVHVDRDDLSAKFWLRPIGLARNFGFSPKELRAEFRKYRRTRSGISWRHGMGILALTADERVADVKFTKDTLSVALRDGRTIMVPLAWYPRLFNATAAQRKNWRVAGGGYGIHWPDIDEDLSTEGLLRGAPVRGRLSSRLRVARGPEERLRPTGLVCEPDDRGINIARPARRAGSMPGAPVRVSDGFRGYHFFGEEGTTRDTHVSRSRRRERPQPGV